jgi:drug/metabolite transporter (DMT)-like permease
MIPASTIGVLVTVAGVAIVLSERITAAGELHWLGDAAVAASALVGAVCSVLYRPYLRKYPALPVSAIAMLASVAFLAVLSIAEGSIAVPLHLSAAASAVVIFIGVISGIGYFLWLYALRHAAATRVTIFLALSPLTAALLGAFLLDEPMTGRLVAGTACVIGGLWLGTRAGTPDARTAGPRP